MNKGGREGYREFLYLRKIQNDHLTWKERLIQSIIYVFSELIKWINSLLNANRAPWQTHSLYQAEKNQ